MSDTHHDERTACQVKSILLHLIREKVPYAFGLCGHGNIGFIDALYERAEEIKTISTRHELGAANAAVRRRF